MDSLNSFSDFITAVNPFELNNDEGYENGQIGQLMADENDLETAELVLVGYNEWRGAGAGNQPGPDEIRRQIYKLYHWHPSIRLADIGNVNPGAKISDSYAALKLVVSELLQKGKKLLVFGGSHDNTIPLYQCFVQQQQIIEVTVVDALIDLDRQNPMPSRRFLLELLTSEPNYLRHLNLIGFQSYFANPGLLETIDKLRFDCFRVGRVQERMEEVEPAIRSSHLLSIDLAAVAHAYAPSNLLSPNGFTGQDMCKIMQYAGMSDNTTVTGIFNFSGKDPDNLTAMQIAQMVWYFIDGMQKQKHESPIAERKGFIEYHTLCAEVATLFLQSKNTNRWWMQMPNGAFIPCSHSDYLAASHNELPERWLRTQERL